MVAYVKKNNTVTQSMSQIKATHLQSSSISFSRLLDPPLEQLPLLFHLGQHRHLKITHGMKMKKIS